MKSAVGPAQRTVSGRRGSIVREMRRELLPHGVGDGGVVPSKAGESCLQCSLTSGIQLSADRIIVVQIQQAQQRPERHPMHDKGTDNDTKRDQDDQVTEGKI
jgi:hypothetical protein